MFEVPTLSAEEDPLGPFTKVPIDGGIPGFASPPEGSTGREGRGTCNTATCISFVTLGYCIVIIALGVSYRKYRPRDRSKRFDEEVGPREGVGVYDETEVMNPVYDHSFRSTGSSSVGRSSLRGSIT
jgi:hypothetical protein